MKRIVFLVAFLLAFCCNAYSATSVAVFGNDYILGQCKLAAFQDNYPLTPPHNNTNIVSLDIQLGYLLDPLVDNFSASGPVKCYDWSSELHEWTSFEYYNNWEYEISEWSPGKSSVRWFSSDNTAIQMPDYQQGCLVFTLNFNTPVVDCDYEACSYAYDDQGNLNSNWIRGIPMPVPEPSSLFALAGGIGALGIGIFRKRK